MSKNPIKTQTAKVADKAETIVHTNVEISLHTRLDVITDLRAEIKERKENLTANIGTVYPMINAYVQELRKVDPITLKAKKSTLVGLIKKRLASKEPVINTACNVLILNLSLPKELSLTQINYVITMVNSGTAKAKFNKKDAVTITALIKADKKVKAIIKAKALIGKK